MIARRNGLLFAILMSVVVLTAACAEEPSQETGPQTGSITAQVDWSGGLYAPLGAEFSAPLSHPPSVLTISASISGLDMATISRNFNASAGSGVIDNVPVGTNRTLTLVGYNSGGTAIYQGITSSITVVAGNPAQVTVQMNPALIAPLAVTGFNATGLDSQVDLAWTNPTEIVAVAVLRRQDDTFPTGPGDSAAVQVFNALGEAHLDTPLTNNTTYLYAAFAYNAEGVYSTGAQSGTTPNAAASIPGAPGTLAATASSSPFGVILSWSAPTAGGEVSGYKVFRVVGFGGVNVLDPPIASISSTSLTYLDTAVISGNTYNYAVVAYNAISTPSNYLPSNEDSATMPPGISGLIAHYQFSGNANDSSVNNHNGTLVDNPIFTTDRDEVPNSALQLDGISQYVELPDEASFDFTTFTIYAIVKIPDYSRQHNIIGKGTNTGYGNYNLHVLESTGKAGYVHDVPTGNWSALVTLTQVATTQYVHLAVTLTSSQFKAYLNGVLTRTVSNPPAPVLNNFPVRIGAHTGFGFYFKGAIDELQIYDHALSATEIAALFNSF